MDIHIRRATKKDMPTIIQLQKNDAFSHPYYVTLGMEMEKIPRFGR